MKVRELIKALSTYDGDLEVVVANYEFGFDALREISEIEAVVADEGEAQYVSASPETNGAPRIRVVCLGPAEPSRLEEEVKRK